MPIQITLEGFTNTMLGIYCDQCNRGFLYLSGAVSHWENFDREGRCPDRITKDDEDQDGEP